MECKLTTECKRPNGNTDLRPDRHFLRRSSVALLCSTVLAGLPALALGADTSWTGAVDDDWFNPGNWSLIVPDNTHGAYLGAGFETTVVIDGAAAEVHNLNFAFMDPATLTIQNGGSLTNYGFSYIGMGVGQTGTLVLTGDSKWQNTSDVIIIGNGGTGIVTVQTGSDVLAAGTIFGNYDGGVGSLTINGSGSTWTDSATTTVGKEGTGTLTVSGKGIFEANAMVVGANADSVGLVVVENNESIFSITTSLDIGVDGDGGFSVLDDAGVVVGSTNLGVNVNGEGYLTIDGHGSQFVSQGSLNLAVDGYGEATVSSQGKLFVGTDFAMGVNATADGILTATGQGSEVNVAGTATIGDAGDGQFKLEDGAAFNVTGDITLGEQATGFGLLRMSDSGTTFSADSLVIGASGAGSFILSGGTATIAGTVTLADQAGSTGNLFIGTSGSAGAGGGTLDAAQIVFGAGDGRLNLNHTSAAYTLSTKLVGAGTISVNSGNTFYTGDGSGFSGVTNVTAGKLFVSGVLGGTTSVWGGSLGGTGLLETVFAESGGTIAPGNSIGTLNVTDVTFNAGSTYLVEVEAGGTSDLLNASNTATTNGGAVSVVPYPDYALGTAYTILTAANGVSGTFDSASFGSSAFVTATMSYDANNAYVTLSQTASLASAALTPNQWAAATGADSLGAGNAVFDALAALDAAGAQAAFDAISGEIHASVKTGLIEESRYLREAVLGRLAEADDDTGAWTEVFGAYAHSASDGNAAALHRASGGFLVGVDTPLAGDWTAGFVAGFSHSVSTAPDRMSSATADTFHAGLYGGIEQDGLAARIGGAYALHLIGTDRDVAFQGFADSLSSNHWAGTGQLFGELAYKAELREIGVQPFANIAYVNHINGAYSETGGAAALTAAASTTENTFATLGVRGDMDLAVGETPARFSGTLGWRHAFGDATPGQALAFAGGDGFAVDGVPIARDTLAFGATLDVQISETASLAILYTGQIGSGVSDHAIKANLGVKF